MLPILATNYPRLSAQEEREIVKKMRPRVITQEAATEAAAARDRLIQSCIPLAVAVAKKAHRRIVASQPSVPVSLDDYIEGAMIFLTKAADSFRLEKRTRFATYATLLIQCKLRRWHRSESVIYVPMHLPDTVRNKIVPLDVVQPICDGGFSVIDDADERVVQKAKIKRWLTRFTQRDRMFFRCVMRGLPMSRIAAIFGISSQRAWQIRKTMVRQMREWAHSDTVSAA